MFSAMNSLQLNTQTGFIEALNPNKDNFDSEKKFKVIDFVRQSAALGKWPKISQILKEFSIANGTFYLHLEHDQAFREAFEDARSPLEDHIVSSMVENASKPQGTTDRIFLLKNLWKQRWNENFQVGINVDSGRVKGLFSTAIEAEIVSNPQVIHNPVDK